MRITFVEITALLLIIAIVLIGANLEPVPVNDALVVVFGDSITYGLGTSLGKDYASLLSKELSVRMINAGAINDNTSKALNRLQQNVLSLNPDVVIVFLGGNDFIEGVPANIAAENLKKIADQIQKIGAKVILVGISYRFISDYERAFEQIAHELNVAGYVPNVLSGIVLRPDLMTDQIHPNDAGHQIIAQRIRPVLEKVLSEL